MGRIEGLIGLALGRSPYDEQVVNPANVQESSDVVRTGQRYDDHGRPVNPETRQRMRDHIRSSNEVMQAAGIIEETADVQARDMAFKERVRRETEMGLRHLEAGRVLLVAGVWGVCGFRRRILLYNSYSSGLLDIIRYERAQYSALHMVGAGLPAMAVFQGIEWLGLLCRALISGPNDPSKLTDLTWPDYRARLLRRMLDYGFGYVLLNYRMFAIIQQLNMWPSSRLLPSLRSLIPFSAHSPLQLPPSPSSLSTGALWSWTTTLFFNVAPLALVFIHSAASSFLSSLLYDPVYQLLPKPANPKDKRPTLGPSSDPELTGTGNYDNGPDVENHDPLGAADSRSRTAAAAAAPHNSAAPSQHAATLEALEGRPPPSRRGNDFHDDDDPDPDDDDEDHELSQQTLITFDVEAAEMTEATMGSWSAELRSAADPSSSSSAAAATTTTTSSSSTAAAALNKTYRISALTMLPPLLAAEGLSTLLAHIALVVLPLEAVMVRSVARAYRRSAGLDLALDPAAAAGLLHVFAYRRNAWANIFAVQVLELAVMGAVWTASALASSASASASSTSLSSSLSSSSTSAPSAPGSAPAPAPAPTSSSHAATTATDAPAPAPAGSESLVVVVGGDAAELADD